MLQICKVRPVSDDEAVVIIEQFLESVNTLISISDDTQDWVARKSWLHSLLGELWHHRGAYPGLIGVLNFLKFYDGIKYYRDAAEAGNDKNAYDNIISFLTNKRAIPGIPSDSKETKEALRNYKLLRDSQRTPRRCLPRIYLSEDQIANILSSKREENGIYAELEDIYANPYILSEQYIGSDSDDYISFNTVDNGIMPSPDLGLDHLFTSNSAERFRALCIDALKKESPHSFVSINRVIDQVNDRLAIKPDWKKVSFEDTYFEADLDFLTEAMQVSEQGASKYVYLKAVYEDERKIQAVIQDLASRPDIKFKTPVTGDHFYRLLRDPSSPLLSKAFERYEIALRGQAAVCEQVFPKAISIISGAAGTGKTTLLKVLITNIERADGLGGIFLLAPTGKAADRIKEKTGKSASTIHSFLASHGWLNKNLTLKRWGGGTDDNLSTLIIDECSMINLELFAALMRAIDWNHIRRLILVGDPNQLPPIGRGKVFSDVIEWLKENYPENLGILDVNVRQLENNVTSRGNGILSFADIYVNKKEMEAVAQAKNEAFLKGVQEGGDVDQDLRVLYWRDQDELEAMLKQTIIADMEKDSGGKYNEKKPFELWRQRIPANVQTALITRLT